MNEIKNRRGVVKDGSPNVISKELLDKIKVAKEAIKEFYETLEGKVYISFSGGKDSTVLLHLVRSIYPNVRGMFLDTGLEYPEIRDFVKTFKDIDWMKPNTSFRESVEKNGIPYPSKEVARYVHDIRHSTPKMKAKRLSGGSYSLSEKWKRLVETPYKYNHKCCDHLKKNPADVYFRANGLHAIIGTMSNESSLRKNAFLRTGFNNFTGRRKKSTPMSMFTEEDVWDYIRYFKLPYVDLYDRGLDRTGCMFCLFGIKLEQNKVEKNRLEVLKDLHPKIHDYVLNNLNFKPLLDDEEIRY